MNDEIDQHLEMQDTNSMLMQQFGNESESQEEGMSPYQFSENFELASPNRRSRKKEKIIEKLLSNRGKFNEKASLFNLINSLQLAITLYNLTSIVNIEGQSNLKFYDNSSLFGYFRWNKEGFTVYYLITILVMVHILKLLTCLVGYFCVVQKSEQLLTIFMMLTFTCVITRGIITILILIDYGQIEQTQSYIYGDEDKIAQSQTIQFTVVLVIFVAVEIVMGLQSLLYAGQAKEKYKQMRVNEKKIGQHYQITYQITLRQYMV